MNLILKSSNASDLDFFQKVSKKSGLPLKKVQTFSEMIKELKDNTQSILISDVTNEEDFKELEKLFNDEIGMFSPILNPNRYFYVSSKEFHELQIVSKSEVFGHYIHRNFSDSNIDTIAQIFKATVSDNSFGIEQYSSVQFTTKSIVKTDQKSSVLDEIKSDLNKFGVKPRIASIISTAIDELIMNAIFDAPVNEMGKPIYQQTPRNSIFDLTGKNIVDLKYGFDDRFFIVSVLDQHGSLDKKKLLGQHLSKSYEEKQYVAKNFSAGAGLGLSHVLRNSGGMIVSCSTGEKTEVILFFKKTESFKDFKDQFRFLSTFIFFS